MRAFHWEDTTSTLGTFVRTCQSRSLSSGPGFPSSLGHHTSHFGLSSGSFGCGGRGRESWVGMLSPMALSRRNIFSLFREESEKGVHDKKEDTNCTERSGTLKRRIGSSAKDASSFERNLWDKLKGFEYPFLSGAEASCPTSESDDSGDSHSTSSSGSNDGQPDNMWSTLIRFNSSLCPRSVLFIPGHKPRALKKALAGIGADCYILDLEDSVGPTFKREARECIRHFLEVEVPAWREEVKLHYEETATSIGQCIPSPPSPRFIVRMNSPDENLSTALLDLDFIASLGNRIEGVAIPKVSSCSFEKVQDYVYPSHSLWALFETPKSILEAKEICLSNRYKAAVMGYNDLSAELQLPSSFSLDADATPTMTSPSSAFASSSEVGTTEKSGANNSEQRSSSPCTVSKNEEQMLSFSLKFPLFYAAMKVLYAARSSGKTMFVLDGVFNDPTNKSGFQKDLRHCFSLGFHGKTLIHPSQVNDTNKIYCPSATEIEWAREVETAMKASKGNVATVRGKMVEALHVRQAQRILQLADNALMEDKLKDILPTIEKKSTSKRH